MSFAVPNWLPSSIEPCFGADDKGVCGWSSRADHRARSGTQKEQKNVVPLVVPVCENVACFSIS